MTYRELLKEGQSLLLSRGVPDGDLDAGFLLEYVCGLNRAKLLMKMRDEVPAGKEEEYRSLLLKRAERIPLQQLTGTQDFCGLNFRVNEHVLIPRQDTELLVEKILKECPGGSVLDMCTGSGCIAISLAKLGCYSRVCAADLSEEALCVARGNAEQLEADVTFFHSDLFSEVPAQQFDVIVSNPPYITAEVIETLEPEVRDHEPYMALYGPEDGLFFYRKITAAAGEYLTRGGRIYFEIGYDQGEAVSRILTEAGFQHVTVSQDYAGLDRIVSGSLGE